MSENSKRHPENMGELFYINGPKEIHCWSGTVKGCEEGFSIVIKEYNIETANGMS